MAFNSFPFLFVFLPAALILFYALGLTRRLTAVLGLLAALSLAFYAYADWKLLLIFVPSIVGNYLLGLWLQHKATRLGLTLGVGLNIALLFFFKYVNFFNANLAQLFHYGFQRLHIILPLAISFYTFQQIAFLVDCYRGQARERSLVRYFVFITFFPQLNQGPIVRHGELAPQLRDPAVLRFDATRFATGIMLVSMGLVKKVLIADQCGIWANAAFAEPGASGLIGAWVGALAYTMQIYFDFSGYTDMALGLGRFFNLELPINFDSPYKATSFVDFWRRWHITLSRFLRDYLYIPLGGNRGGQARQAVNILITMLLGGLWHGANWTFVVWGGFHGGFIAVTHLWRKTGRRMPRVPARVLTFVGILVGWVFFRASTLGQATQMLAAMTDWRHLGSVAAAPGGVAAVIFLLALTAFVNLAPNSMAAATATRIRKRYAVGFALMFFLALLGMYDGNLATEPTQFIYQDF